MKSIVNILILALVLGGCAPQLTEPQRDLPSHYRYGDGVATSSPIGEQVWWESHSDPTLRRLIAEALVGNRSLASQMASVRAARYNLTVARAGLLPSLSMDVSAERYREEEVYSSEYEIAPTVSWQIPLFGSYKSTMGVARAELESSEWALRGAMLTLASEVATTYYTMLQYRASREVSQRSLTLRTRATALIDSMYRYGMSSGVELSQARALVFAAQQSLYSYDEAVRLSELSLALLLGRSVDELSLADITTSLGDLPTPHEVPAGLPSDLLYNRPDLMESYYNMQQAMGEVGIARAAQFPSLSLTLDGGFFSTSLSGLTFAKLLTWDWAVSLAQPLFNFKSLKSKKLSAVEGYNAALYDYEQTILSALKDVESALLAIVSSRLESLSAKRYMDSYAQISHATSALYRGGMDNYLSVVDAQREYYSSQIDYVELLAEQQINYITLYTALGCSFGSVDNQVVEANKR